MAGAPPHLAKMSADLAKEKEEALPERPPNFHSTIGLLFLVCVVEGADAQLLPSTFRALEADLGLSPTNLAHLGLMQGLAMAASAPVWGSLADHGWPRKWLLSGGAVGWGTVTILLGVVTSMSGMLVLRFLNGVCLGTLTPVSQSLVADLTRKNERGFFFGIGQLGINFGAIMCAVFAASVSNETLLGVRGWRVAFAVIGILSLGLALLLMTFMSEPARLDDHEPLTVALALSRFRGYWRITTFKVIVGQGVFGSIPWSALSFSILFFQYCGISDFWSAMLYGFTIACCGIGGLAGGLIADWLASLTPNHGRALAAQISVIAGVPIIATLLEVVPADPSSFWAYVVLMGSFGLTASWCGTGVNRPIMSEIVDDRGRASIIAWLTALEGSSAAIFGGPVVGLLAEHYFGYEVSKLQVSEMPAGLRHSNAQALSDAMLFCCIGPWVICFCFYSYLHVTYGPDVAKAEEASAARSSARATTALI